MDLCFFMISTNVGLLDKLRYVRRAKRIFLMYHAGTILQVKGLILLVTEAPGKGFAYTLFCIFMLFFLPVENSCATIWSKRDTDHG